MADDVQGVSLRLTEEDIRRDCAEMKIPYSALMAVAKRHRAQNTASQIADVLHIMMLAKSKGLNPIDDNYSLIARPDDKGFSLTFNKSAALHVINNHPKVKHGAIARRFMVTGKGERVDIEEHPERIPGSWKLNEIDWEMTAIFEIEAAAGGILRGFAKYKACFAAGRDGNPKFLWLKDPLGMTMKQAEKDLANTKLDGSLPEVLPPVEDEEEMQVIATSTTASPRQIAQTVDASMTEAPEQPSEDLTTIIGKGTQLGLNEAQVVAACRDQQKAGMTLQAFESEIDKQLEARAKMAVKSTSRRTRKAQAEPEAKPEATKKEQKPRTSLVGIVEAIAERNKELPKKEGETEARRQPYLLISIGGVTYYMWDSKWFDDAFMAMESKPPKRVKVEYTESQSKDDPPITFFTVAGFELMEEPTPLAEEPSVEEHGSTEDLQEAQVEAPEPAAARGGFLF